MATAVSYQQLLNLKVTRECKYLYSSSNGNWLEIHLKKKTNKKPPLFLQSRLWVGLSLCLSQTQSVFGELPQWNRAEKNQFKNQTSEGWGESGRGNGGKIAIKTATWPYFSFLKSLDNQQARHTEDWLLTVGTKDLHRILLPKPRILM